MQLKPTARNHSIDIFRYFFAVTVLIGHCNPFNQSLPVLNFVLRDIIARMTVPYFFAVAGYFYIRGLEAGKRPFWPYIRKLLFVYAVWSAIYFLESLALDLLAHRSLATFLPTILREFFLTGARYHFWFFPVMFFSVIVTTLVYRLRLQKVFFPLTICLYLLACLIDGYSAWTMKVPFLSAIYELPCYELLRKFCMKGLPAFYMGYLLNRMKNLGNYSNRRVLAALAAALALFALEAFGVRALQCCHGYDLLVMMYPALLALMVFLFNHPLSGRARAAYTCRLVANFTYYVHPFVIDLLGWVWKSAFHTGISADPKFFLTWGVTAALGLLVAKWNNARVNRLLL